MTLITSGPCGLLRLAATAAVVLCAATAGWAQETADLVDRIDTALAKSGKYLISKQSPDGAWRSETYGAFKDGPSLTPIVLSSLFFQPQAGPEAKSVYRAGVNYLLGLIGEDGSINPGPQGLLFPVLTSASASRVVVLLDKDEPHRRAQAAWLAYLRERQLVEPLGWNPADPEYGGWGFSLSLPRKPPESSLKGNFVESNLVATIFGIAALRSAKIPADDPVFTRILVFVQRCQNYPAGLGSADSPLDDGGFFFIPDDPGQNKAGEAGVDRSGRRRFYSYGTMTADGLRALIRCGLPADQPRVQAARSWLERNFSVTDNPGRFAPDREVLRNATYYYWCWAVAHAFQGLGLHEIQTPTGKLVWGQALAEELMKRQRPDGSWLNHFTDAKEDDPLLSTSWAASALALSRLSLLPKDPQQPFGPTLGTLPE